MSLRSTLTRVLGSPLLLLTLTLVVVATTADHPRENQVHESHGPLSMGNDHHHPSDGGMQFGSEKDPQPDTEEPHHAFFPIHELHRRLSLGDLVGLVFHLGDTINDFRAAHTTITVTPGQPKNDSKPANTSASVPNMTQPHISTLGPELKPSAAMNSSNSTQTPAAVGFATPEINLKKSVVHAHGPLHHTPATASAVSIVSPSSAS